MLRHWPVTKVTSVTVNDVAIAAAVNSQAKGYVCERWDGISVGMPQRLGLRGYRFSFGLNNVCISYNAGYKITAEPQIIASSGPAQITVNAPYGNWGADVGVTYADGTVLTLVTTTPMHGQYSVSAGVYSFASADAGVAVLIS